MGYSEENYVDRLVQRKKEGENFFSSLLDKQKKDIHNAQPRLNDSDVKQVSKLEQIRRKSSFFLPKKDKRNEKEKNSGSDLQKEKNFCIVRILVADEATKKAL